MSVSSSAGTTFALTAAAPVSQTQAGYEALVYTEVGEVSDLGDVPAQVYELVTWRNVNGRGDTKQKGGYSLPPQTITVGYDPKDAGQALVSVATNQDALYSIRISHPSLGDIYGQALVMGGAPAWGDVNTVITRPVTLEYVNALFIPHSDVPPNALLSPVDGRVLLSPIDGRILTWG